MYGKSEYFGWDCADGFDVLGVCCKGIMYVKKGMFCCTSLSWYLGVVCKKEDTLVCILSFSVVMYGVLGIGQTIVLCTVL